MSTSTITTIPYVSHVHHYVARVLAHGEGHVGGRDGARRHAQSIIDRTLAGQCFTDAAQEEIDAAQALVDCTV